MLLKDIGEIRLIDRISNRLRLDKSVVRGIGDDAAVIRWTKDKYLLLASDMLVQDVHFRLGQATPRQIGWKALGRNISDIAAMGGVSKYALVSIAAPSGMRVRFVEDLYRGMDDLARRFGVSIVGGDTARSDKLVIDVSIAGEVEKENLVLRSGAKPGDLVLMTGAVGGSVKGRHLDFMPRQEEARRIVKKFRINSMIDISDGLLLDLGRVLDASKVGARIYKNAIPLSDSSISFESAVKQGEDFELLFTMNMVNARRFFRTELCGIKTPIAVIGEIAPRKYGYRMVDDDGDTTIVKPEGYVHFS